MSIHQVQTYRVVGGQFVEAGIITIEDNNGNNDNIFDDGVGDAQGAPYIAGDPNDVSDQDIITSTNSDFSVGDTTRIRSEWIIRDNDTGLETTVLSLDTGVSAGDEDNFIIGPDTDDWVLTATDISIVGGPNGGNFSIPYTEIVIADGIVDGEEFAEVMELGYDDANPPTDQGGDQITNGADTIEGNGGDDTISGEGGNDDIDGGSGEDLVTGGSGNDTIDGGVNDDTLFGSTGDDSIVGGTGNDSIHGDRDVGIVQTSPGTPGGIVPLSGIDFTINDDKVTLKPGDQDYRVDAAPGQTIKTVKFKSWDNGRADDITLDLTTFQDDFQLKFSKGDSNDEVVLYGENINVFYSKKGSTDKGTVTYEGADGKTYEIDFTLKDGVSLRVQNADSGPGTPPTFNITLEGDSGDLGADTLDGGAGNDTIDGGAGNDSLIGGGGNDRMTGGTGFDDFTETAGSGADTVTDFGVGDSNINDGNQANNDFVNLAPFFNSGTVTNVNNAGGSFGNALGMLRADAADGRIDGVIGGVDYSSQTGDVDITLLNSGSAVTGTDLTFDNTNVVCFAAGTLIATIEGLREVEALQAGDLVLTMDNGYQPLRWLGHRHLDAATLQATERLRPIRIKAGALGANTPETDLVVSPQHRMLLRSKVAFRMFGEHEVLVSARSLAELDGVDVAWDEEPVTYFHLMFDQHEIVYANGTPAESLYLGKMAIATLSPEAKREILEIFPNLEDEDFQQAMARYTPEKGKHVRKLLERHAVNGKPVMEMQG